MKVPPTAPSTLTIIDGDIINYRGDLVRIHRTTGRHPRRWNELRHYGPLHDMRYDPQKLPPRLQDAGVLYAATDMATALAEVFQVDRLISVHAGNVYLAGWRPTRPLRLLDLTGHWPIRNQAAYALNAAERVTCRAWARAIHDQFPDLDGLYAASTMTGRPTIVLWERAADSFPEHPDLFRSLPELLNEVHAAAASIGYRLIL